MDARDKTSRAILATQKETQDALARQSLFSGALRPDLSLSLSLALFLNHFSLSLSLSLSPPLSNFAHTRSPNHFTLSLSLSLPPR